MAGILDTSSDACMGSTDTEQQETARGHATSPARGATPAGSVGGGGSDVESDSQSESDVLEHRDHPQPPQLPLSPSPSPSPPPSSKAHPVVNLQLMLCRVCEGSSSFAYCLTARSRNGGRHVPRLRVVKGPVHRKRCKAVLVPGQREPPAGAEDGSTEDLVLSPENLALR